MVFPSCYGLLQQNETTRDSGAVHHQYISFQEDPQELVLPESSPLLRSSTQALNTRRAQIVFLSVFTECFPFESSFISLSGQGGAKHLLLASLSLECSKAKRVSTSLMVFPQPSSFFGHSSHKYRKQDFLHRNGLRLGTVP